MQPFNLHQSAKFSTVPLLVILVGGGGPGVPIPAVAAQTAAPADTEAQARQYSTMAPVDQYLIADRSAEIALARSAAPAAISKDATVLVLTRSGYEKAAEGTNGFVCSSTAPGKPRSPMRSSGTPACEPRCA